MHNHDLLQYSIMRIRFLQAGCTVLVIITTAIGVTFLNPLRLSSIGDLEREILLETPIGTSRAEVREVALQHDWKILEDRILRDIGSNEIIGGEIDALLGRYTHISLPIPIPLSGLVWAHWHFDRNENLEWVKVTREVNGT